MFLLEIQIGDTNPELKKWYEGAIETHNRNMDEQPETNAGFDLCLPEDAEFKGIDATFVSLQIKAKMVADTEGTSVSYTLYPRSSLSKTPLMMANHVGIIDSGYRGHLIVAFRNLGEEVYHVSQYTRLVQICHPSLKAFRVKLVDTLGGHTARGEGGFGSTGL